MKAFRVWVRPLDYEYLVCVDGVENARWLLDQLGRSFVFRSAQPISQDCELVALHVSGAVRAVVVVDQAPETVGRDSGSHFVAGRGRNLIRSRDNIGSALKRR